MDATWQERFAVDGYAVFEGFLEPDHGERLRADVDELMARRELGETPMIISLPELGLLTSHPPVLELVTSLMGGEFALHHIHASRHDTGREGVGWHQDYEQYPQTNRTHLMVHVFYYLNGLNGEVGDLILLPRSQGLIFGRNEHQVFGTADLPGSVVVDLLAPGSVVIVHSAVLHGRRPKPGARIAPATSSTSHTVSAASAGPATAARSATMRSIASRWRAAWTATAVTHLSTTRISFSTPRRRQPGSRRTTVAASRSAS